MDQVTSADGTRIAVETVGSGPPVVFVVGAFCDRGTTRDLAALLADRFTLHAYDRRGRGDSDRPPVGPAPVAREVEDLAAVVAHAGGVPALYGHSSGAILALRGLFAGLPVSRVAAYEPPWAVGEHAGRTTGMADRITALLAEGRNEDAVELFLTDGPGMPPHVIAWMRQHIAHLAPSLPYDLALAGDQSLPAAELAAVGVPALVMDGGESDAWARATVTAVAAAIPGAEHRSVPGQGHGVDAAVLAPLLDEFLR